MKPQQIKFDKNGECFVTFHGKKHLMSDFMRFNKPMTYTNKGKETTFHGYKVLGNSYGLLISLSSCGETAMITLNY